MRGSHRFLRRRFRAPLTLLGLTLTLVMTLGPLGLVPAGATDRDRDGSYSSDTGVTSDEDTKDGSGGGGTTDGGGGTPDASGGGGGLIATRPTRSGHEKDRRDTLAAAPNNVTVCHATSSVNNPFNSITVDVSSAGGQQQILGPGGHASHDGTPDGNFFDPATSQNGDDWTDIIPPFKYPDPVTGPNSYPGLGWTAQGQAIHAAGCAVVSSLSVTKARTAPATVTPGSTVTFTVTVTNTGTTSLPSVTVTDTLPAGLVPQTATFGGGACAPGIAGQTVTCNVGSIAVGGSATVTITALETGAPATCSYQNTASATSRNAAGGTVATGSSNTVTITVQNCAPAGQPDMSILKSATATVTPGGQITYTLNAENLGNASASNVTVSDSTPAGTTFVGATAPAGWSSTTPAVGASGTITFTKATVAAGETAQFTVVVQVAAGATCGGVISNTATVSPGGSNAGNDSSTATTTVVCPNVAITKSGGPTGNVATGPGGVALSYTVTVTNTGAAAAPDVQIVDDLDDQLTGVSAVVNGAPPGAPTCSVGAGNVVTCGLFDLAAGGQPNASGSVMITATVPAGLCITVTNSASGSVNTGAGNQTSIGPSNTLTTTVTGCGGGPNPTSPAISILKTANPPTVQAGDPVSYSITVTSSGTAPAVNVTLTDTLPTIPGTTWSISSQPAGNPCSLAGNSLTCNFGTMNSPPQTSVTVTVTTTPTTDASCGTYRNTASASAQGLSTVTSSATVTVGCPAAAGLDLNKTGPATAKVGDTITYTFTVALATGSPDLSGVTITDPICDPGTLAGPTGDDGDGVLEAGETWTFTCTHLVTASDPDPLPNTATACATSPAGTVCDSDNHEVDITHPGIRVVKTADPISGTVGTRITYTYTVTNSGDVPLSDVSVDDDVLGHICDISLLKPHETVTCTGTYVIPAGAPPEITNVVIAGGTDPAGDLVEDRDDFTIAVVAGETITKTPPGGLAFTGSAAAIPFTALALALLTAGTALLWAGRRRERRQPEGPPA